MTSVSAADDSRIAPHIIPSVFKRLNPMIKIWSNTPADQLTPKAGLDGQERRNPFDVPRAILSHHPLSPGVAPRSPSSPMFQHHHLLNTHSSSANGGDLTPLAPGLTQHAQALAPNFAAALPTTQLSLHAPEFKMQQPPQMRRTHSNMSSTPSSQTAASPAGPASSKGQLHVKLIQARALNVQSVQSRPYVVVQFEQNEFVGRDPIAETEKEVKGVATNMSRNSSSTALSALGAIGTKAFDVAKRNKTSANSSPQSSVSSGKTFLSTAAGEGPTASSSSYGGIFGRMSSHNPVWKHEVSFDVISDQSLITFNIYDRAAKDQGFLGMVEIKPALVHDHTLDQWYKMRPYENEVVTGEMRVQITYEQFKTKRALTPRDFEFLKLIGRGTFGRVFQVRKRDTKRIYAMKVLSKREIIAKKEVAHTIGERKILQQSLNSPFLVGLKFSFQTDTDLYLVTDFKSGGELFWHLQKETRFTEERARFYIAELVLALEHLHKYDIVYRDLKPENILLDATGHVALCDFGLSKPDLKSDQLTNTFCGTTEYLAPEVLLDDHGYSKLVDFWSLGVLLFEMCCGWSPFYAEDTQQMYKNICFGKIRFPKGVIGEDGKQFVKGLLNRNPKHRLGSQRDAEEMKEHPFFKSIDWSALSLKQVTPPFKPVVESDESTSNFDPEFTSADLREAGIDSYDGIDEEDPSEDWVSQSIGGPGVHMPNGPLGSDMRDLPAAPGQAQTQGQGPGPKAVPGKIQTGIEIARGKKDAPVGSPLTSSVQEHFRGFSYTGESLIYSPAAGRLVEQDEDEEAVELGEAQDPSTEDEYENDAQCAGRYARRKVTSDEYADFEMQ